MAEIGSSQHGTSPILLQQGIVHNHSHLNLHLQIVQCLHMILLHMKRLDPQLMISDKGIEIWTG